VAALVKVRASVVDIGTDQPTDSDRFLVDSNVWYWQTYSKASHSARSYQITTYPSYMKSALNAGAALYRCGLSLSELASIIENTEFKIYQGTPGVSPCDKKEFRHNCYRERAAVQAEVEGAWLQVKGMAAHVDITVDESMTDAALVRFGQQAINGYDLYLAELLCTCGVHQVLTDDGDFATVPGIEVYTANANVLKAARLQGRLQTR
jgi:hypothetical protein